MADWVLIPCLKALFTEFDRIAPSRDHASDGAVGDQRHQDEVSDHNPDETGSVPIRDSDRTNEVHAIDVDDDLRESDLTMEKVVQFLLGRCRSGAERRLRYIIYNRRIWSASSGWVQKTYTGASPHTEHAHFSASYNAGLEASTASWGLIAEFGGNAMLVKKGEKSDEVKFWQVGLADLGYKPGAIDGDYGPTMEAAVNAFRKAHDVGPLAAVDPWTGWAIIRESAIAQARKYAGKDGKDGAPGAPGQPGKDGADGKDGVLSGRLTVVGGQLDVEAAS